MKQKCIEDPKLVTIKVPRTPKERKDNTERKPCVGTHHSKMPYAFNVIKYQTTHFLTKVTE